MKATVWNDAWRARLWFLYRFLARARMLSAGDRLYENPEGERFWINPYSFVERCIGEGGFEKTRAAYLRNLLNENDVFIDIGANIGLYTVLAARRGALVIAFEPDPFNYKRLVRNIGLNRFRENQVTLHSCALGKETGEVTLRRPLNNNYGMASMVTRHAPDGVEVPLRRLDDLLKVSGQRYIVKMDVEGAELQVLEGARASLEKMREGSLWLVEIHQPDGVEVHRVADHFQRHGYEVSYFDDEAGEIVAHVPPVEEPLLVARRRATSARGE